MGGASGAMGGGATGTPVPPGVATVPFGAAAGGCDGISSGSGSIQSEGISVTGGGAETLAPEGAGSLPWGPSLCAATPGSGGGLDR